VRQYSDAAAGRRRRHEAPEEYAGVFILARQGVEILRPLVRIPERTSEDSPIRFGLTVGLLHSKYLLPTSLRREDVPGLGALVSAAKQNHHQTAALPSVVRPDSQDRTIPQFLNGRRQRTWQSRSFAPSFESDLDRARTDHNSPGIPQRGNPLRKWNGTALAIEGSHPGHPPTVAL